MPDVYRHPEPSSTNPYWEREIAAGPALVARGGNRSKAGKNGNGGRKGSKEVIGSRNASLAGGGSSWDLNVLQQREDERLWGEDTLDGAAAGIQRPGRVARVARRGRGMSNETNTTAGTASTGAATAYSNFRSPPVSELLPPIVRTVHSREEVAWMMQPPPVADVMSGKREGGRGSGASSRQGMARTISRGSSAGASQVLGESPRSLPADMTRRPSSRGAGDVLVESATTPPGLVPIRRIASRPPLLSTIASEGHVPSVEEEEPELSLVDSAKSQNDNPTAPKKRRKPRARSNSTDPTKVGMLKGRIFTTPASVDSSKLPSSDESSPHPDTKFFNTDGEVREELFDSWYTPDFELDRWVHEHTRREGIRERWSFDV